MGTNTSREPMRVLLAARKGNIGKTPSGKPSSGTVVFTGKLRSEYWYPVVTGGRRKGIQENILETGKGVGKEEASKDTINEKGV